MMKALIAFENFVKATFRYIRLQNFVWKYIFFTTVIVTLIPLYHFFHASAHVTEVVSSQYFDTVILNSLLFIFHVFLSTFPLVLGPWMFVAELRRDRPDIHRKFGYLYVIGCIFGAISVFPLAISNGVGFVAHLGFGTMSWLWFFTTYFAYTAAVNKQFVAHRRWMLRSYAMTYAFVHVNLTYKFILPYEDLTLSGIQAFQSMVSWLSGLLIVEIYMAATAPNGRFLGKEKWLRNLVKPFNKQDKFLFWPLWPKPKYKGDRSKRSDA